MNTNASLLLNPALQAASVVASCSPLDDKETDVGQIFDELESITQAVTGGDMKHPEAIAVTQATALNVVFGRLARMAFNDMQGDHFESLMRLAFRAQAQSVRALDTLSTLKNPSVYAEQLNVANQQLINNGPVPRVEPIPHTESPVMNPATFVPPPALSDRDPNLVRLAHPHLPVSETIPSSMQT